jgi:3-deoxy-7-phosphoheptulonate synthase
MAANATFDSTLDCASLRPEELDYWRSFPAAQQPRWEDPELAAEVVRTLTGLPALAAPEEIDELSRQLADTARGERWIVQAGDCAEDPEHRNPTDLNPKIALLAALAEELAGRPVIQVGRLAGQFAKPRSQPNETIGQRRLPAFRGLLINGAEPDPAARRHDADRLADGYRAAAAIMTFLRSRNARIWTSHDALALDYELPLVRRQPDGRLLLTSTHWPWIGERTRQLEGAHVHLLASISNPIACKVGPAVSRSELLALCDRLDPRREPGRLTLIARLGAGVTSKRLAGLVESVGAAGHPVIWLCDPMHGNTLRAPSGYKSRVLSTVCREIVEFRAAVQIGGGVAGGLHLEVTPDRVNECVWSAEELAGLDGSGYRSLCDPRLNAEQAVAAARCWTAEQAAPW